MNKAKIILSALGVLAVIGSALAFKANKTYSGDLRCSTFVTTAPIGATAPSGICPAFTYSTIEAGAKRYCTNVANAECVVQRVQFDQ